MSSNKSAESGDEAANPGIGRFQAWVTGAEIGNGDETFKG